MVMLSSSLFRHAIFEYTLHYIPLVADMFSWYDDCNREKCQIKLLLANIMGGWEAALARDMGGLKIYVPPGGPGGQGMGGEGGLKSCCSHSVLVVSSQCCCSTLYWLDLQPGSL